MWIGRKPGIYETWDECNAQVKGFSDARYKSFRTKEDAEVAYLGHPEDYWGKKGSLSKKKKTEKGLHTDVDTEGVAVDVSCRGPNGPMEFRGIDLKENNIIFSRGPFEKGTSNIGEFLAIVEALHYLKNKRSSKLIYSDSLIAIGWVREKVCNTTLPRTVDSEEIFVMIEHALLWLRNNEYPNKIRKWNTNRWGEIPADYGRK